MTAGWSAGAKAAAIRQEGRPTGVRGVLLRMVGRGGPNAATEAVAARWEAGEKGEQMTHKLLEPLTAEGWRGFYDRALPGTRANVDHVLLPSCGGFVVNLDSKLWSKRRGAVGVRKGRMVHGGECRLKALDSVTDESRRLATLVGVPVVTMVVVHSAPVEGGQFTLDGVRVLAAPLLVPALRALAGRPDPDAFWRLARRADANLPRYVEGGGR